jgi:hypothetical protein
LFTPKRFHSPKLHCDNLSYLFSPLTDAIVIEHILTHLPMNPSMIWHLCQVNQGWYKVVGGIVEWQALEIVKYHNTFHNF